MRRENGGEMGWEWMDGGGKAEQGSAVMHSNLVRGSFFLSCAPPHTDWVIRATHLAHFPLSQAENEGNQRRKRPLYHCLLLLWYPKAPRVFVDELLLLGSLPSLIFTFPFSHLSFLLLISFSSLCCFHSFHLHVWSAYLLPVTIILSSPTSF